MLTVRHLQPLSEHDRQALSEFGQAHGFAIFLQPGGLESVHALWPQEVRAVFRACLQWNVELAFRPLDFIQVNASLNEKMIDHALCLLDPRPEDRVLDLFCGLGNFTLPLARGVREVVGVEGDAGLVARAGENAERNGLGNAQFFAADLTQDQRNAPWMRQGFDKLPLDPPRSGAIDVRRQLPLKKFERIVYVSCHPGSLARDAGYLVNEQGFTLKAAGAMDMFPHTRTWRASRCSSAEEARRASRSSANSWSAATAGSAAAHAVIPMAQGYINDQAAMQSGTQRASVRVRIQGQEAFLNLKSRELGHTARSSTIRSRSKTRALLALCVGGLADKRRHLVQHAGYLWEADEFSGDNAGAGGRGDRTAARRRNLQSARSGWAREVTDDARYYNLALAAHPYNRWPRWTARDLPAAGAPAPTVGKSASLLPPLNHRDLWPVQCPAGIVAAPHSRGVPHAHRHLVGHRLSLVLDRQASLGTWPGPAGRAGTGGGDPLPRLPARPRRRYPPEPVPLREAYRAKFGSAPSAPNRYWRKPRRLAVPKACHSISSVARSA